MFGIDSPELLVIAIVALVVIGPKELPGMLRSWGKWMAKMRGMAAEFDTTNPIPEPERFFAGGDTTVRGFALDTLGVRHNPTDAQSDTIDKNGFPIGGNATVILNGELRVPFRGGLSVVSFFDTGNVFQCVSQLNVTDLRNVQLKFKVTKGEGAVIVFTSSIDNGTADQVLRTD